MLLFISIKNWFPLYRHINGTSNAIFSLKISNKNYIFRNFPLILSHVGLNCVIFSTIAHLHLSLKKSTIISIDQNKQVGFDRTVRFCESIYTLIQMLTSAPRARLIYLVTCVPTVLHNHDYISSETVLGMITCLYAQLLTDS